VRVKARLVLNLLEQLAEVARQLATSQREIERFFARVPVARQVATLPGSRSGVTLPSVWAEIGDAVERWRSAEHLQAVAGTAPVTQQSGTMRVVHFRFACKTSTCAIMHNSLRRPRCCTVNGRGATTAASGIVATITSGRCAPWPASGSRSSTCS
jgi:hypothetical protein